MEHKMLSDEIEILNVKNLEHTELTSKITGEKFSLSAVISSIYNFKDLFIDHEILLPGRKSSSPHLHTKKEEMIFVLTGKPTVYVGNRSMQLNPGDFIGFKPATDAHYLENLTNSEVHILMISLGELHSFSRRLLS
jgi:uncharacterized cupin superfamily protein